MILLVEDDVGTGRSVSLGLSAKGHAVRWVRRGAGVLDLLAMEAVAMAILDAGLPDADGFELCRRIREAGHRLPILILTARGSLDDRLDGFAAGADDYLPKPFAFAELVARVAVLARRATQLAPEPVHWGTLCIDAVRGGVARHGVPLEMEPKPLALFGRLAQARGTVVPRQDLIDVGWGQNAVIADNTLDVAISALRKRLADLAPEFTVKAIKGQGFRLELADLVP
jgi:DNA-binding response OmpR family regulator